MHSLIRRRGNASVKVRSRIAPYLLVAACALLLSGCVLTAILPGLGWVSFGLAAVLTVYACSSGGGGGKKKSGDSDIEGVASISDASALEGAGSVNFLVTLAESAAGEIKIDYATTDGTAEAGTDYEESSGTLTIDEGDTEKTISVPTIDDSVFNAPRSFLLELSDPEISGVTLDIDVATATGTIKNDEAEIDLGAIGTSIETALVRIFKGEFANDRAGSAVAAGDLTGDSNSDLIIGAKFYDDSMTDEGRVYIVEGTSSLAATTSFDDIGSTVPGYIILGDGTAGKFGSSVASVEDGEEDGKAELLVTAPSSTATGLGQTFLVQSGGFMHQTAVSDQDEIATRSNVAGEKAGRVSASAGDMDGDGLSDLIIGDDRFNSYQGRVWLVSGAASGTIDLNDMGNAGLIVFGHSTNSRSGFSVAGNCDIDGDGKADTIVGEPGGNNGCGTGNAYFIFGNSGLFTSEDKGLGDDADLTLTSNDSSAQAGWSVACAGDINGDGKDDVVIGAPFASISGPSNHGIAYVVFGTDSLTSVNLSTLNGSNGFVITDSTGNILTNSSHFGRAVAGGKDLNGDDLPDILVSTHGTCGVATEVFVIFGDPGMGGSGTFELAPIETGRVVRITAEGTSSYLGESLSFAGDVNGDGFEDIILGEPYGDSTGRAYVIFGGGF